MKTNKVYVSTAIGLCALLLAGTPNAQAAFQDTAGHWAESAIGRMNDYHIVNGYQGRFRPDETITRGEMAVVLDHVMRYQQMGDNQYMDLGQDFYTEALLKAGRAGVIQGANGRVRPNDPILREEAVSMMARAFDVPAAKEPVGTPDGAGVSDWAAGQVSAFVRKGYLSASEPFRPQEPITRAEVVSILNRMLSGYYPMAGSFTEAAGGTVVVNTQDVVLRDMSIGGDLILAEGVQDGDIRLDNVTVEGRVLIRGGGAHSIHVTGTSKLGTVVMERDGAAVRLAVEDSAKVKNVMVGEKASEAIVTGQVSAVTVAGSGTLKAQDAKIETISVTAPDASVELTGKSSVRAVEVAKGAKNVDISVEKQASVRTVQVKADGAEISGAGKVSEVKADADHIAVDTKDTTVKAAAGTTGITAGGQKVSAGSSSNSTPSKNNSSNSSNSSSSGSSGSHRPSKPKELAIERVESVQNGLVRMTLNRASDNTLTKDQFSIICTGGGKDMTILNVYTTDNRVYDITTAYYKDNTYQLGLTLEDGKLLTYDFVSKYDCPTLTSAEAVRTAANEAEFSFVSDASGTFYWKLEAKQNVRFFRAANGEPTAEEIMASGNSQEMHTKSNTVRITGLDENTPYTLYYVAEDTDHKVTPVKYIEIAGTPAEKPEASDITIEEASGHWIPNAVAGQEHVYFDIKLSAPTKETLTKEQFKIMCPNGEITLGRVEPKDNQNYRVYMAPTYIIEDGNFTLTITFDDERTASKRFYVDLTAPEITDVETERTNETTAKVRFTSSEAGTLYWRVMEGSEFGAGGGKPKDPDLVVKHGTERALTEGSQYFDVDLTDVKDKKDLWFCFIAEDTVGNRAVFDYYKITDPQPKPDGGTTQGSAPFEIIDISGGRAEDDPNGKAYIIEVTVNKDQAHTALLSNENVKIVGNGVTVQGKQKINVTWHSEKPKEYSVKVGNAPELKAGDYTLEVNADGKTISKQFNLGDDDTITMLDS